MSVHYKFKSAITYDTIAFDGLHISVRDLKKAILHQKQIGKSTDFDLQITNAQSNEVYIDEAALIPKNSSLIVVRVPLTAQQKKAWEKSDAANLHLIGLHKGSSDSPDHILNKFAKSADLTSIDASEEDKIQAAIAQSTLDYDPSNYVRIKGSNQVGEIPSNYRCYKCMQPGHWIKDCKLNVQPDASIEIKKSTGIPRSFMVPVEGPDVPGAMMTPTGQFAVPTIDHQARQEASKKPSEPVTIEKPVVPEDLLCGVCKDLLTDAVMIPCCGNSFCDECIRNVLLESEDHQCPDCKEKDVSPDTLIPNRFLRNSVNNFKNQTGYSRVVPLKPPPAPPPKKAEEYKEPETPISGEPPKESVGVVVPGSQAPVAHTEPPAINTKSDPHLSEPIEVEDDSPNSTGDRPGMPYPAPIPSICSQRTFSFNPHMNPHHNQLSSHPHSSVHPNPRLSHPPHIGHSSNPHSNPIPFPPQGPPPGQVDDQRHHHHHHPHHSDMRNQRDHYKQRVRDDHHMSDDGPHPRYGGPELRPLMAHPPPHIRFSQSGGYQVFQPYRPEYHVRGPRPTSRPPPPYTRHVPAQPLPPAVSPTRPSSLGVVDTKAESYDAMFDEFMSNVNKPFRRTRSFSRSSSRSPSPRGRSKTPPRRSRSRNRSRTPKVRSPHLKSRSPLSKKRSPIPLKRPRGRSRSPRSHARSPLSRSVSRTPPPYTKRRSRSRSRSYFSGSRSRSRSLGRGSPRRRKRPLMPLSKLSPPLSPPSRHYSSKYGKDYSKLDLERPREIPGRSYKSSSRRQDYSSSSRSNTDYLSSQEYARVPDRFEDSRYSSREVYSKYIKDPNKYISPSETVFNWDFVRDREEKQQEREKMSSFYEGSSELSAYQAAETSRYPSKRRVVLEQHEQPIESIYNLSDSRGQKDHKRDRDRSRSDNKEIVDLISYDKLSLEHDIERNLSPDREKTPDKKSKEKRRKKKDETERKKKKRRIRERSSSKIIEETSLEEEQKEVKEVIDPIVDVTQPKETRDKIKGLPLTIKAPVKTTASPALDDLYQGLDASVDMHALDKMSKEETRIPPPMQAKPIPVISAGSERSREAEEKAREIKEILPEKDVPKSTTAEADSSTAKDVVLAPVPELSKWEKDEEKDDDILILNESKESYDSLSESTQSEANKQVTSEVIKRAENAIFKKVVNPMKTQNNDKKVADKNDRMDRTEKNEKSEKIERIEKTEKVEKIDKNEKIERIERRKDDKKEKIISDSRHRDIKEDDRKKLKGPEKYASDIITFGPYSRELKLKVSSAVPDEMRSKKSGMFSVMEKEKPRISAKERLGAKIDDSGGFKREIRMDKDDKHSKQRHEKDKELAARIIHMADHRAHKESRKVLSLKNDEHRRGEVASHHEKPDSESLTVPVYPSDDQTREPKPCKKRPIEIPIEDLVKIKSKKSKVVKEESSYDDASDDSSKKLKKKKRRPKKKKRRRRRETSSDDSDSSSSSSDSDSADEELIRKKKKKKRDDRKKSHKKSKKRKKARK